MEIKQNILARAKQAGGSLERLNLLREELHHLILQEADRKGAFGSICFMGGTALRVLYGLDRFSEDLDFSVSAQAASPFSLKPLAQGIQRSLSAFGFACQVDRLAVEKTVQSCFFSFGDLLRKLDKSFQPDQKLKIKFEADTNPPMGAGEVLSPITGIRVTKVRHYDLPSLFAGKIHALLHRTYTKGRDLYDFLWYTGRPDVSANKTMLENAIAQTTKTKISLTDDILRGLLRARLEQIDFKAAKKDMEPFLVNPQSLTLFDRELFLGAAKKITLK